MFAPRKGEFLDVAVLTVGRDHATALGKENGHGTGTLLVTAAIFQLWGPSRFSFKTSPAGAGPISWRLGRP